jgi:hypothetical protein
VGNIFKIHSLSFGLPVLLFYLFLPSIAPAPIRGDHLHLIYRWIENDSLWRGLWEVGTITDINGRPQFLAGLPPWIPYKLFGLSFRGYFLFSYFLHITVALSIARLVLDFGKGYVSAWFAFVLFLCSYYCLDTVNWSFYTFVQLSALLVMISLHLVLQYHRTQKIFFFRLANLSLLVATFLYEIHFCSFFALALYVLLFEKERKKLFIEIFTYVGLICFIVLAMYKGLPAQADANHELHWGILSKSLVFGVRLVMGFWGLSPQTTQVSTAFELPKLDFSILKDPLTCASLFLGLYLSFLIFRRFSKQENRENFDFKISVLGFVMLGLYTVGMCYARVRPSDALLPSSYFEIQFRYYYLPLALIISLFFIGLSLSKLQCRLLYGFLVLCLMGNLRNISLHNQAALPYYRSVNETFQKIKTLCDKKPNTTVNQVFSTYYMLWIQERIASSTPEFLYSGVGLHVPRHKNPATLSCLSR